MDDRRSVQPGLVDQRHEGSARCQPDVPQPFANYNLGKGLATGISMEASADWKAPEVWTAPLLFSVSKVTLLGKQPVNIAVAAGPTIVSPAGGSSWRFRLSATFLFPR